MSLVVENVTVGYYQDVFVLHDVSIEAEEGKITSVVGPNGAGKSTLLKTIYGFLKPKNGRVTYNGKEITGLPPFKMLEKGIAYITQDIGILPHMSVEENLQIGAWLFRKDKELVRTKIEEIYKRYPTLRERRSVIAGRMSGGEQRMLEIGKALMNNPTAILFDEPSTGLAPKLVNEIYGEIAKLKYEGRTIILVEQNVRKALSISDYIYVLELGKVKFGGTRGELDIKQVVLPWLEV